MNNDNKLMIAVFVAVLCFSLLSMSRANADDGVMDGGFVCYTAETVQEKLDIAFASGERNAAIQFFDHVAELCESGQKINLPDIGVLSCEGVKK